MADGHNHASPLMRERLEGLRQTWRYALAHSPYYRDRLPRIDPDRITAGDLAAVPVCSRQDLADQPMAFRCETGIPAFTVFTGGTSGQPRIIFGTEEELDARQPPRESAPGAEPAMLVLATDAGHHGFVPLVPGRRGCFQVPLRNRKNYRWALDLLAGSYDFVGYGPRITLAMLPLPAVKKLVHYVLEQGSDVSRLALEYIGTYAWYLSPNWRRFIESTLNVTLLNHFGFSEIPIAVARECLVCGAFHYGPQVMWNIADPLTGDILPAGVGKLQATSLYPYTRDHIIFRYEPGDLVEVGDYCSEAGEAGFYFRGRVEHSVVLPDGDGRRQWLLFPVDVQRHLDFDPTVARMEEARFTGVTSTGDDSFAKWCILRSNRSDGRPVITVVVEMKYSPALFRAEWNRFSGHLRAALLAERPPLRTFVESGLADLVIEGRPPGGLPDEQVFQC
ncbi:hypothetical protein [Azospirillum sp. B506]|uniref:hypothetical protein n=1 Tax=Azospirillum sp. B506 TaxID=137721 RepID=UPI0003480CD3|nr:hypothetical protein [Azospirillum sp. B506]